MVDERARDREGVEWEQGQKGAEFEAKSRLEAKLRRERLLVLVVLLVSLILALLFLFGLRPSSSIGWSLAIIMGVIKGRPFFWLLLCTWRR